ncbi:MAG: ribosome rescue protein RqcH, partial [Candidatus Syntropharchaeia archaeon]
DISAIVSELSSLIGAKIDKAYQHTRDEIRIRLVHPSRSMDLILEAGKRIHETKYPRPSPKIPPAFPMFLRKNLKGGRIRGVRQCDFDRVVEIEIERGDSRFVLVIELFSRGNIILLDESRKILLPMKHMSFRDRKIKKGEIYQLPPSRINPLEIKRDELRELLKESEKDVVRTISTKLGIGGLYGEEICLRAGVDKNKPSRDLSDEEIDSIMNALNEIFVPLKRGELKPNIVMEDGRYIDVVPFELLRYKDHEKRYFSSFNDALDEFFSKKVMEEIESEEAEVKKGEIEKLKRVLDLQMRKKEEFEKEAEECMRKGNAIYENYKLIEEVIERIKSERKRNSWDEIKSKIEGVKIDENRGTFAVEISDTVIEIDFRLSVNKNAQRYYERAKILKGKIEGIKKAIENTKKKIEVEKQKKQELRTNSIPQRRIRRKKHWYDKFRWFFTSDGFLVVGGKDADTNEELVKKYMEKEDIFLHTETPAAPVVIVKTEGREVSEQTLKEAAQFSVSYSSLWREGLFEGDCYVVSADQVSKTPESGEYIRKGSFIVRGKRRYFRDTPVGICIGVEINEETRVIGGPPSAIRKRGKYFIDIEPGEYDREELAKILSERFFELAKKEEKRMMREVASPEEIVRFLPPGRSRMKE